MTLPQLKKLVDEYHVFGTSLTRVRGHEILKELAGSFPSLYAALVDMHSALKRISDRGYPCNHCDRGYDEEYCTCFDEMEKTQFNIFKGTEILKKHAALFNETKETK